MKKGRLFEELVESIYRELDPSSQILRNDKIYGHDSGILREIDVSIRGTIGPLSVLIVIQAKDLAKPCDINIVGEFVTVIRDIKANKGVLVSSKGFTQAARNLANRHGIELLTAHDNSTAKWKWKVEIPVVLTSIMGNYNVSFEMEATEEYVREINSGRKSLKLPNDGRYVFVAEDGKSTVIPMEDFKGRYRNLKLTFDNTPQKILYPNMQLEVMEGLLIPARNIEVSYQMKKEMYIKNYPLKEFRGFIDKIANKAVTSHFKIEGDEFIIENDQIQVVRPFNLSKWSKYIEDGTPRPLRINVLHFPVLQTGKTNVKFLGNAS